MDDTSDILGQQSYPKLKDDLPSRFPLSFTTGAFLLAALIVLYLLGMWIWEKVLVWREKAYKLSMRRRYGIPDTDHRPFNVAYADIVQARRNNEAAKKRPAPAAPADRVAAPSEQTIRQRPSSTPYVPGAYSSFTASGVSAEPNNSRFPPYGQPSSASDRYSIGASVAPINPVTYDASPKKSGPTRRYSRKNLEANGDVDVRKRTLDEEEEDDEDVEHGWKKTKVEGDELIDGDEDAEWENEQNGDVPVRGSKRGLGEEDEIEVTQSERSRDKRARKVSLEKTPQTFVFEDMDVDEDEAADEVPDLTGFSNRGKKRDRAEAGSTFGGDDEESAPEHDEDDAKSRRRRRKRRTVSNGRRKSDAAGNSRGKKRDRDIEDSGSDMENEEDVALKSSRKKRGKRGSLPASRLDEDSRSDDDSLASSKGRGRRIGDEWEVNGIRWKVGPNGQRLRQALVKKARQKFVMPKDSQHPDREANLEVYVETWLTEEEYEDAKSQHLLAWQDSPKASTEPENLTLNTQIPQSPLTATGKNLLWNTVTPAGSPMGVSPAQTPIGIPTGRQIAARDLKTVRANPFNTPQKVAPKRIAGTIGTPRGGLNDSTNGSPRVYKVYSKWEKQELEARAMNKIREAERAKEQKAQQEQLERERALRERLEKEKAEKEMKDREAAAAAAAAAAAKPPAITIAPASTKPATAEPAKSSPFSFGKPADAAQPKASSTADPSKPSLFNAPPLGSTSFAAPSEAAKPADKPAAPSFSFPASTPAAPTTTPSAMPNNFFKPAAPTPAQPAATPAPTASPFGQPPAPAPAAKSSPFSFGPAPTAAAPATAPTSGPATTSPFGFGATSQPAENKDSLLSRIAPPSSSNASAEQSKPSPFAQPSNSPFSFGKPDAAKTASPFGAPTSSAQTPAPPAPAAPQGAAPKFNFGVTPAATATPTASSTSSSLSGALTPKPTPSATEGNKFSFAPIKPPATESKDVFSATPSAGTTNSAPAVPKFSFGPTGAFGAKPAAETKEAPKSTFSFAPSTTTTTTTTATSSGFGSTGFSGFGASSKPADKPSPFAFAAPSSSSAAPATTETPKSGFTFGGNTTPSSSPFGAASTPAAANTAPTTFKFGAGETKPATTTTPFGTPGTSVFGGSSAGLSAFGFGAPSTGTTSAFGAGSGQK